MPLTAQQKMQRQQERTARIAQQQQEKAGYSNIPGFDPTPTPRTRFTDPRPATTAPAIAGPGGTSKGVISTPEQEAERRRKAAAGRVLTNADL